MTNFSKIALDRNARYRLRKHQPWWGNVNGLALVVAALLATILITGAGEANFRAHDSLIAEKPTKLKLAHCPARLSPHDSVVR